MDSEPQSKEQTFSIKTFFLISAVVIGLWVLYWYSVTNYFPNPDGKGWDDRGLFGDMFGGINSLFSGLAFVGVICAILMQRIELKLQREELKLQREVMNAQVEEAQALVKQASTQAKIMQAEFEIAHKPKFVCENPAASSGAGNSRIDIHIVNLGETAANLFVKNKSEKIGCRVTPNFAVKKNEKTLIQIVYSGNSDKKIEFIFGYESLLGRVYQFACCYNHQDFKKETFFSNPLKYDTDEGPRMKDYIMIDDFRKFQGG